MNSQTLLNFSSKPALGIWALAFNVLKTIIHNTHLGCSCLKGFCQLEQSEVLKRRPSKAYHKSVFTRQGLVFEREHKANLSGASHFYPQPLLRDYRRGLGLPGAFCFRGKGLCYRM